MRPIKFRVWDKISMSVFEDHFIWGNGSWETQRATFQLRINHPDLIYLQFTGLHDKHGKEIYEGDICKYFINDPLVVEWIDKEARFALKMPNNEFLRFDCDLEIIGNIYENPELLEEK